MKVNLLDEYVSALNKACGGSRSFFSTTKGTIGIAPNSIQSGDLICIFYNASTPFVLHRRSMELQEYALVGEAYIDGYMFGETLKDRDHDRDTCEVFITV